MSGAVALVCILVLKVVINCGTSSNIRRHVQPLTNLGGQPKGLKHRDHYETMGKINQESFTQRPLKA